MSSHHNVIWAEISTFRHLARISTSCGRGDVYSQLYIRAEMYSRENVFNSTVATFFRIPVTCIQLRTPIYSNTYAMVYHQ